MKVLTYKFEMEHQTGFTDWENNNKISAGLILTILRLREDLTNIFNNKNCIFLISDDLYNILDTNPSLSFSWGTLKNDKYHYGGNLMGNDIYYDGRINKIYCSDSIDEIHRYIKIEERKKKLERINEL